MFYNNLDRAVIGAPQPASLHPIPALGMEISMNGRNEQQPYGQFRPDASGKQAAACLILSLIGFCTGVFFIGIALDVLAVILGILSLSGGKPRKGMAVAGILIAVLSVLFTIGVYYLIGRSIREFDSASVSMEGYVDETGLLESITTEEYVTRSGLLLIYENGNAVETNLDISVAYYDENDSLEYLASGYLWGCAAQGSAAILIEPPHDKNYEQVPYDHYEILTRPSLTDHEYYGRNRADELEIKSNIGSMNTVVASLTNPTGVTFDSVDLICIFYKDGIPVGASNSFIFDCRRKETVEFQPPVDENYEDLPYDDYEIIINSTQKYKH